MQNLAWKHRRGFTLLEILVVAFIITTITVVAFINYEDALRRTRDRERITLAHGLQQKLEQYYSQNGFYPCGDYCPLTSPDNQYTVDRSVYAVGTEYFMNGGNCCGGSPATPSDKDGLKDQGFLDTDVILDPLGFNNPDALYYEYVTPKDGRQSYRLYTRLEGDASTLLQDGGLCDNYYELWGDHSNTSWDYQTDFSCTTPPPPGVCGDGHLDPGEQCDTGSANFGSCPSHSCNSFCNWNICDGCIPGFPCQNNPPL